MSDPSKNPIGFLQEVCARKGMANPIYGENSATGPSNAPEYTYTCSLGNHKVIGESAPQKKGAKMKAAKQLYEQLVEQNFFLEENIEQRSSSSTTNAISAILEYCMKTNNGTPLPEYVETSPHAGRFLCECTFDGTKTSANAVSKKSAKTEAAAKMCIEKKIPFASGAFQQQGVKEESELPDKNPIMALNEMCLHHKRSKPTFKCEDSSLGGFTVTCTSGEVQGVAYNTTKKGAKVNAAEIVLTKLLEKYGVKNSDKSMSPPANVLEAVKMDNKEFKPELPGTTDKLDSLKLEDSSVEFEPFVHHSTSEQKEITYGWAEALAASAAAAGTLGSLPPGYVLGQHRQRHYAAPPQQQQHQQQQQQPRRGSYRGGRRIQ